MNRFSKNILNAQNNGAPGDSDKPNRRKAKMPEVMNTPVSAPAPIPKKPNRRKKRVVLKIFVVLCILAVLGAGGVFLFRFLNESEETSAIYSQPAAIGSIQSKVSGSGNAKAQESAAITLTQSGTVQEVFVSSGQTVMAGQPLYTIFSQAAQDEVDKAQKKLDELREQMDAIQAAKDELVVRAPFAGKLMDVQEFSVDQILSKGSTVATLVNDKKLKLSLYFSYAYENDIRVGQEVTVSVPAVMEVFPGKVEKINKVSYISPEGAVHFEVVVVFDNPGTLTADMDAAAYFAAEDGWEIYPYEQGKTKFYEIRSIAAKAGGPVERMGDMLLNYANVSAGEPLLYLGTATLDEEILAKQAEIDTAQLALEEATGALADFNAVAPINGTIISCSLTPGAEVKSGETVIIISNNTTMVVTIQVDDRNISFVKPGHMVELTWNGMPYMGTVTAIDMGGAQSGNGMTNYPVTLSVDNFDGSLMDGAWLRYSFVTSQSEDCVLVPTTSVKYISDKEGNRQSVVFVKRDVRPDDVPELDMPELQPGEKRRFPSEEEGFYPVIVETGISDAQNVEIVSGIQEMDEVFVNYTVTDYSGSW
ncbi:MAG: HlyD family efflux transporter periplasmic adaptor subunit [Ruminococcaceae bacterium]|nr:HlyD family efflux transporter periplasmic adaptor subunit [Oscillospiraceae bacterium]